MWVRRLLVVAVAAATLWGCAKPTATPMPTATPEPTATAVPPTETPEPLLATRANPVPGNQSYTFEREGEFAVEMSIVDLLAADNAMARLQAENQFSDPPGPGNMYILLKPRIAVSGDEVPESFTTYNQEFWSLAVDGRIFDGNRFPGVVMPEPPFEGELVPPGSIEGWILYEVPQSTDVYAIYLKGVDRGDGSKGFWFDLR